MQGCVNHQEQDLFNSIVDFVDMDPGRRYLQTRRNPDDEDADVDQAQRNSRTPSNLACAALVDHQERNSIDDDAADALDLYDPEAHWKGVLANDDDHRKGFADRM